MERAIIVTGVLRGSRSIELDEPVAELEGPVEVLLRPVVSSRSKRPDVFDVIARLGPGQRSKAELDARLEAERASWNR